VPKGTRSGKGFGRPMLPAEWEAAVRAARAAGAGLGRAEIARAAGLGGAEQLRRVGRLGSLERAEADRASGRRLSAQCRRP
jgi:hypothetical protein